eukprot:CAMPEP_0182906550 /NCGR_PEP_ID=MMETSP0034_2-20130328/33820_1 /TAXON_ID=156128 /ORGANISM="Nephroselmis pyriformis, Strain CCMP717" /LENGTH=67 /DNA_ID=CAMNT_0025042237 /DNA_START=42 /DNA_END=242 /DNA_ORIENTATION=+
MWRHPKGISGWTCVSPSSAPPGQETGVSKAMAPGGAVEGRGGGSLAPPSDGGGVGRPRGLDDDALRL